MQMQHNNHSVIAGSAHNQPMQQQLPFHHPQPLQPPSPYQLQQQYAQATQYDPYQQQSPQNHSQEQHDLLMALIEDMSKDWQKSGQRVEIYKKGRETFFFLKKKEQKDNWRKSVVVWVGVMYIRKITIIISFVLSVFGMSIFTIGRFSALLGCGFSRMIRCSDAKK